MSKGTWAPGGSGKNIGKSFVKTICVLGAAALAGGLLRYGGLDHGAIAVLLPPAVLAAAWLTQSYLFTVAASVSVSLAYMFLLPESFPSWPSPDQNTIATLAVVIIVPLLVGVFAVRFAQRARLAGQKESEAKTICHLTRRLSEAKDIHHIAQIAAEVVSERFACHAVCLCFNENDTPRQACARQTGENGQASATAETSDIKHRFDDGQTELIVGGEFADLPIGERDTVLALLRIPIDTARSMTEPALCLLRDMAQSIALAMNHFRLAERQMLLREEATKERYRANLLRAISHDLRSPLAAIIGASEMLLNKTEPSDPRHGMIGDIQTKVDWLHSLVENILSLTRLQDGFLALQKQPEAVEEIIGCAVRHVSRRFPDHRFIVHMPHELLIVPMEAKLMEQVFINLLNNAVNHSRPDGKAEILVEPEGSMVRFTVRDSGDGFIEADIPRVFQMFYTTRGKHADARNGIGLGLALCDTIIRAHGGDIKAQNRTDQKGAEILFTVPKEDDESEQL